MNKKTSKYNQYSTRVSSGIILFKHNKKTGKLEVLLIHKRYTYAFADFIHGRYKLPMSKQTTSKQSTYQGKLPTVNKLLDNMSTNELIDIWTLDFKHMWFRVWLCKENQKLYFKNYQKFLSLFMVNDNGKKLHEMIKVAKGVGESIWEPPKGHRIDSNESDISCAIRELKEESGVDKSEYKILPDMKRKICHTSADVRYVYIYYVAVLKDNISDNDLYKRTKLMKNMGEVSESKWFTSETIRLVNCQPNILSHVLSLFKSVKKQLK
jgi:predicted NUDIX family NTP pyrophosphohydrolase